MLFKYLILLLPLVTATSWNQGVKPITNLNQNWTVYSMNLRNQYVVGVDVPIDVCTALTKGSYVGNMLLDDNFLAYHWISESSWRYVTHFQTDYNPYKTIRNLVFEGIDTIGSIIINNHFIAFPQNMFIRHRINIQPFLYNGINNLEVQFTSPVLAADDIYTKAKKEMQVKVIPPERPLYINNSDRHINYLRKQQSSFGSQMTPPVPNLGIWKNVFLEPYDYAIIRYIQVRTELKYDGYWHVNLIVHVETLPNLELHGSSQVQIFDPLLVTKKFQSMKYVRLATDQTGGCVYTDKLTIDSPFITLWWPNGYGEQKLYNLTVSFISNQLTISKSILIGFRTVELVQNPIEKVNGFTFFFKINSVPIFMKGAIWVPTTLFLNDESEENQHTVFKLLKNAQMANMNMIRIWAGGVYQSDYFYDLADLLGILIWQDFMFNDALYPAVDPYKKTVEREVREQVLRLHYHPSLIVWCGNSRSELFLQEYRSYTMQERRALYLEDYRMLFVDTIKATVDRIDNTRPFLSSTPSNGRLTQAYNYTSSTPNEPRYGDMHYTTTAVNVWDPAIYPAPRFSSQSGIQSMPHFETFLTATKIPEKHLIKNSKFLNSRQMEQNGNQLMEQRVNHYFQMPRIKDGEKSFKVFTYYSQIVQAMGLKVQIEKHRSYRSRYNSNGEGGTMGTLYWHLNDAWQAPSASTIDFSGRWKMAHYYAKNFYAPVIVRGEWIDENLKVYVVSDENYDQQNVTLRIALYKWSQFAPVYVINTQVNVTALSSTMVFQKRIKLQKKSSCSEVKCFFYFSLTKYNPRTNIEFKAKAIRIAPDNFILPVPIKDVDGLKSGIITKRVVRVDKNQATILLKAPSIAVFVWLRTSVPGVFSDNGFIMVTAEKKITFESPYFINKKALQESLTVVSTGYMNDC